MYLSKLIHEFVKAITGICQKWSGYEIQDKIAHFSIFIEHDFGRDNLW